MKIAVTYENGNVFQHFGRTENFKIYDIEDGAVKASDVIGNNGTGHEALADYLAGLGVNVLICGGLGDGAKNALDAAGIAIMSGAQGDTDAAVLAYLAGELVSTGVNCDHHNHEHGHNHEDGHECGGDCGDGCGGGCGGCGGGCGTPVILYEGPNAGKGVKAHYRGTFDDGVEFDNSYDRGEPLRFVAGVGLMIPGFDKAIVDMKVGEIKEVHLEPEDAYGEYDPNAVFTVAVKDLPGAEELTVGQQVYLQSPYGQPMPVMVTDLTDEEITLDANSEMAGKALNFTIELIEVEE